MRYNIIVSFGERMNDFLSTNRACIEWQAQNAIQYDFVKSENDKETNAPQNVLCREFLFSENF